MAELTYRGRVFTTEDILFVEAYVDVVFVPTVNPPYTGQPDSRRTRYALPLASFKAIR